MENEESNINVYNPECDSKELTNLPIESITPNRFQPRTVFNYDKINELAATIAQHGIIQPIIVRSINNLEEVDNNKQYEIIAGERRWRAALKLGWSTVPAVINDMNDDDTAAIALIENLQREDLSPIEEAQAYEKLLEINQITQEILAIRLGISQSTIANKLRLLKLPETVQKFILEKNITERHGRALIPLKDEELQLQIVSEIINKSLSVLQTEDRVKKELLKISDESVKKPLKKIFNRNMRIAFNTIRQSISMISDHGITIQSKEEECDDHYKVTIIIPKNK